MKYFAKHLKKIRNEKGLDQEAVAEFAGISVRTIQRIEAGKSCSLETIKSLAAALELKHYSLLQSNTNNQETIKSRKDFLLYFRDAVILGNIKTAFIGILAVFIMMCFSYIDRNQQVHKLTEEERIEFVLKERSFLQDVFYPVTIEDITNREFPLLTKDFFTNPEKLKKFKDLMVTLFFITLLFGIIEHFLYADFRKQFKIYFIRPTKEWVKEKIKP